MEQVTRNRPFPKERAKKVVSVLSALHISHFFRVLSFFPPLLLPVPVLSVRLLRLCAPLLPVPLTSAQQRRQRRRAQALHAAVHGQADVVNELNLQEAKEELNRHLLFT